MTLTRLNTEQALSIAGYARQCAQAAEAAAVVQILDLVIDEEPPIRKAAMLSGLSRSTFYRRLDERRAERDAGAPSTARPDEDA